MALYTSTKRDWAEFDALDLTNATPRDVRLARIADTLRLALENRERAVAKIAADHKRIADECDRVAAVRRRVG